MTRKRTATEIKYKENFLISLAFQLMRKKWNANKLSAFSYVKQRTKTKEDENINGKRRWMEILWVKFLKTENFNEASVLVV
jgi:hypothetical protein